MCSAGAVTAGLQGKGSLLERAADRGGDLRGEQRGPFGRSVSQSILLVKGIVLGNWGGGGEGVGGWWVGGCGGL